MLKQRVKKIQEFYEENILGIKEHNNIVTGKLLVYPNPTTGQLRITNYELGIGTLSAVEVEIFDIYGRKLISDIRLSDIRYPTSDIGKSEIEINIAHLPAGIYFLKVGNETVKIVKQ